VNETLHATVLVPTTTGRGALLPVSVGSILAQTVADFEVFIIGDGVDDATRCVIQELMRCDARIRFFDNRKHERRGEPHRHAALAQARGKFICYLCDRDLMLPHHLEVLGQLLEGADFAHTLISRVRPGGNLDIFTMIDIADVEDRNWIVKGWCPDNGIPLSFVGHSTAMYRKLPWGWRLTPPDRYTDVYMWEQFLAQSQCRARSGRTPTILYFPRYLRANWSVSQKLAEIQSWGAQLAGPGWMERIMQLVIDALAKDHLKKGRQVRGLAMGIQTLVNHSNEILSSPR
jgi:glycosyltransferase involved in cell wall biosynthesis